MENYSSLIESPEADLQPVFVTYDLQPVFVTYENENVYNDVKTWTVEKIRENIEIILNEMNGIEIAGSIVHCILE